MVKKRQRKTIVKYNDEHMSRYIRLFHADQWGYCTCVACGLRAYWKGDGIDMGHFVAKGNGATSVRYLHHNCYPLCRQCNSSGGKIATSRQKEVASHRYYKFMQDKLGQDIVDDLIARKFQVAKYTDSELEEIGKLYKEFADELERKL